MKILKIISNIIYALFILVLVVIAVGTAFSVFQAPGGSRIFVVQSGSMEPAIRTGSIVLIAPQTQYQKNEVITFFANPNERNLKKTGATVTHRIIKINNDEGRLWYQTKGDANNAPDQETVGQNAVLGKALITIPYVGYAINFTRTQMGFVLLIVIPATLIIYSELLNIKKEIALEIAKKKAAKIEEEAKNPKPSKPIKLDLPTKKNKGKSRKFIKKKVGKKKK